MSNSHFSTDYLDSYAFCTNKFDANLKKFIAAAFPLENFIYETCFAAIKPMLRQFEMRLGFFSRNHGGFNFPIQQTFCYLRKANNNRVGGATQTTCQGSPA